MAMSIWVLGVMLVAGLGALGRQIGSIRMGVSLIGAIVAYVGTLYLTSMVAPMMESIFKSPITIWWITPLVVYIALFMVINAIGQGLYMKVHLYFNFRAKEDARLRWAKVDTNLGLALGIANGCVLLTIISVPIYIAGYVSVQFKSGDGNDPFLYNMLNRARTDLTSTGFDKVSASIAPKTPDLFQLADTAAVIYHNKSVQDFLADYPEFYTWAEEDFIFGEEEEEEVEVWERGDEYFEPFSKVVTEQPGLSAIIRHPRAVELLQDGEFMSLIEDLDLADLSEFIATGISPNYATNAIVGKWRIDIPRSINDYARRVPKLKPTAVNKMHYYATPRWADVHVIFAPDGQAYLKGKAGTFPPLGTLYLMARDKYAVQRLPKKSVTRQLATGSWKAKDDGNLEISLKGKGGSSGPVAKLKGGFLSFIQSGNTFVGYKYR